MFFIYQLTSSEKILQSIHSRFTCGNCDQSEQKVDVQQFSTHLYFQLNAKEKRKNESRQERIKFYPLLEQVIVEHWVKRSRCNWRLTCSEWSKSLINLALCSWVCYAEQCDSSTEFVLNQIGCEKIMIAWLEFYSEQGFFSRSVTALGFWTWSLPLRLLPHPPWDCVHVLWDGSKSTHFKIIFRIPIKGNKFKWLPFHS